MTGIDYYLNSTHTTAGDLDLSYDDGGNITSKSDLSTDINYGETGHGYAGPHALTSIEDPVSAYKPPPQMINYTSFNKVSTIQDTIGQDTTLTLAFTYGINNQRVKTVLSRNTTVERIKYFDGDYEEDSTASGTKKYHYINSPTGLIGIFVKQGSADTLYHVLSDHLGSLNGVINAETDSVTYYSYSAWGIPRDADDWTSEFERELFAGRGYTGHEHLMEFNLINMNGRVHDPVLGRFLSPDPYVQAPGYANSFNRYSYVLNNPLIFTDPSGYRMQSKEIFKAFQNYDFSFPWSDWVGTYNVKGFDGGGPIGNYTDPETGKTSFLNYDKETGQYYTWGSRPYYGSIYLVSSYQIGENYYEFWVRDFGVEGYRNYIGIGKLFISELKANFYDYPVEIRLAMELINIPFLPKAPDAIGKSMLNLDLIYGAGLDGSGFEKIKMKNGPQIGLETTILLDIGTGFGLDVGLSGDITNYYYFGDISGFSIDDFYGDRVKGSLDFGYVVEAGMELTYMNVDGGYILGISRSIGVSPFPYLSGNINFGASYEW